MLIKMTNGGLVDYSDSLDFEKGMCSTSNYDDEYITTMNFYLTKYTFTAHSNQQYDYIISEGFIMKLLCSNIEDIYNMSEEEFIDWLSLKLQLKDKNIDFIMECK